ncbi:MAG: hypothetical protein LBQ97_02435 [Fusobacteriaceae bacterium]|jgi:hypothetical protein|nr:hypothetical protein [Fusobacteriaceae bacterium]
MVETNGKRKNIIKWLAISMLLFNIALVIFVNTIPRPPAKSPAAESQEDYERLRRLRREDMDAAHATEINAAFEIWKNYARKEIRMSVQTNIPEGAVLAFTLSSSMSSKIPPIEKRIPVKGGDARAVFAVPDDWPPGGLIADVALRPADQPTAILALYGQRLENATAADGHIYRKADQVYWSMYINMITWPEGQ